MEKIRIDCGCCNGHTAKQEELWRTINKKVRELWPDIDGSRSSSIGCWARTELDNSEVSFKYSIDSSD